MRSHNAYEMNTYRDGYLCLSVRVFQLENRCTDLDKLWYGRYVIGHYSKNLLFNLLLSIMPTWRINKLILWIRYLHIVVPQF